MWSCGGWCLSIPAASFSQCFNKLLAHLRQITREEIRQAARKYLLPDELRVLVVGRPAGDTERAELELATGYTLTELPMRDPLTLEPSASRRPSW